MTLYNNKYRVETNRASFLDYSAPARYFITINIQHRKCILGRVVNGTMELSVLGRLVKDEILKIPQYHKQCILDEWVVMPNHIHLLIELAGYNYDNGMAVNPDDDITTNNINADGDAVNKIHEFYLPAQQQPPTGKQNPDTVNDIKQYRKLRRQMIIPKILGKFQMQTSKQINRERQTPGVKNWQNNYYDHVVRDEASYQRIKQYIKNNPAKWNEDTFFER